MYLGRWNISMGLQGSRERSLGEFKLFTLDEHMESFFEVYRNYECLWNNKSEDYHKTNIREKAYQSCLPCLPQLSVHGIKEKIKAIRTCYISELTEVRDEW